MGSTSVTPRIPPAGVELLGPMVTGIAVAAWCPTADGSGEPEAVAIVFNMSQLGDVVLRLKSREEVDEMIAALNKHADSVFGPRDKQP